MQHPDVILVDEQDNEIGTCEKMKAHELGLLHRAFSVFIFNSKGEMMLQQRAEHKYHSGGLWTNACCSHPYPGESALAAANRRLQEEMGFTASVKKIFDFKYEAPFSNGLIEHEFDHVFVGEYEGAVNLNTSEVKDYTFKSVSAIESDLELHADKYTAWFHLAFPKVKKWWQENYNTILA